MSRDMFAAEDAMALGQMIQRPMPATEGLSFWHNVLDAVGPGLMHGGALAAQAVGMAGAVVPMAIDKLSGGDNLSGESMTDKYFSTVGEAVNHAVDYWKLPAGAVGTAGQIVHGLAGMVLPLAAAGGNPSLLMGAQGFGTAIDLAKQGVDPSIAVKAGMVSAATTGLGLKLPPALGATRLQSAAIGAAVNPAMGIAERGSIHRFLAMADYEKIAAQYQPLDPMQLAVESISGAAFGAIFHGAKVPEGEPTLTPDEHAAALTMNEVQTRNADTLARPGDIAALNAGHEAQAVAVAQMNAGEMVSVSHVVKAEQLDAAKLDELQAKVAEVVHPEVEARTAAAGDVPPIERSPSVDQPPIEKPTAEGTPKEITRPYEPIEIASARDLVMRNPDMLVRMDDGTDVRAADLLRESDATIKQAEVDASLFKVAVSCFLGTA